MISFFYSSQLISKIYQIMRIISNLPPKICHKFSEARAALTLSFLCILSKQVHLVELLLFWELLLL